MTGSVTGKIIPVILCGGTGTRLWPSSRQDMPKQFLALMGEESLIQKTARRVLNLPGIEASDVVTVSLANIRDKTAAQLDYIDPDLCRHIIAEPEARNTAAAFILAGLYVHKHFGPDALMLVVPADHHIADEFKFANAVRYAAAEAAEGKLVTFGVTPTRAETGYGYIKPGEALAHKNVRGVLKFSEKPNQGLAHEYLRSGEYLWSTGIHLFTAQSLIEEYRIHAPGTLSLVEKSFKERTPNAALYKTIEKQPYENAVLEKSAQVAVVPVQDLGWSDIGTWESLWEISQKDKAGNVRVSGVGGKIIVHETSNSLIHAQSRMVACIGVENLVIVETLDAILIADKSRSDDIKTVVTALQEMNAKEAHCSVSKNYLWGTKKILSETAEFRLREISVTPKKSRGMRTHNHTKEVWVIASGEGLLSMDKKQIPLLPGDNILIPPGKIHSVTNTGTDELKFHEFHYSPSLEETYQENYTKPGAAETVAA